MYFFLKKYINLIGIQKSLIQNSFILTCNIMIQIQIHFQIENPKSKIQIQI